MQGLSYLAKRKVKIMENPFKQEYFKNIPDEEIEEIYRNPRLKLPFDPKDLVMFLDRKAEGTESDKARRLRTIPYHHRSADLGITTPIHEQFPAGKGEAGIHHVYTQIDIKGSGFVHPEEHESKKHGLEAGELAGSPEVVFVPESIETPMAYDILGLLDAGMVKTTADRARQFAKLGMRTETVAGIYGINTIRMNGEEISVQEFKKQAILILKENLKEAKAEGDMEKAEEIKNKIALLKTEEGFSPVIEVRCMRSVLRLRDLKDAPAEARMELIKEAVNSLNIEMQYLGIEKRFTAETPEGLKEWMNFIAYWFGKNMGIMHSEGTVHNYLHMGNLTLAGEIVDLDSVYPVVKTGKGNGARFANEPCFTRTEDGYAYLTSGTLEFIRLDDDFGLPISVLKDLRDVCYSLRAIRNKVPEIKSSISLKDIKKQIAKGYRDGLGDEDPFKDIGITSHDLIKAVKIIGKELIRFKKRNVDKYRSLQSKLIDDQV